MTVRMTVPVGTDEEIAVRAVTVPAGKRIRVRTTVLIADEAVQVQPLLTPGEAFRLAQALLAAIDL